MKRISQLDYQGSFFHPIQIFPVSRFILRFIFSVFIFEISFRPNLPSPLPTKRARSEGEGEDATNSQNELLPLNKKNDDNDSDDNDSPPADLGFFDTN